MKVLVLGGSGFIGARVAACLAADGAFQLVVAGRQPPVPPPGAESTAVNILDKDALALKLSGFDAVVNCVGGDANALADGAAVLAEAVVLARTKRIVHLSTMSVYGQAEGVVTESTPLKGEFGWYAEAKRHAEAAVANAAGRGARVVVLRPGCVYGPGSSQWVARIATLLQAGRLGDLGVNGDGWSNLVHVDDVARAVRSSLGLEREDGELDVFNLAGSDSPRWNEYFIELGRAIGAIPVPRISRRYFKIESKVVGPGIKVAERVLSKLRMPSDWLPEAIPPSLARLWRQEIRLDSSHATSVFGLGWTSFEEGVDQSAIWFLRRKGLTCSPTVARL